MISLEYKEWPNKKLVQLLDLYALFPFHLHPLWQSVFNHELTKGQIVLAESQHYLRTKAGQPLRKIALENCALNPTLFKAIVETYIEECMDSESNVNHLTLIKRILYYSGLTEEQLRSIKNTPGNIAAIALYKDIGDRGAGCHIIGAGVVEYYYSLAGRSLQTTSEWHRSQTEIQNSSINTTFLVKDRKHQYPIILINLD